VTIIYGGGGLELQSQFFEPSQMLLDYFLARDGLTQKADDPINSLKRKELSTL
jgi:hypothetical protein